MDMNQIFWTCPYCGLDFWLFLFGSENSAIYTFMPS